MAMLGTAECGPVYCQCSNPSCGVLLQMAPGYKQGSTVGCPECGTPFTITPDSPGVFLDSGSVGEEIDLVIGQGALSPFKALCALSKTPDSARSRSSATKKEALFQFPSPSASDLAMLDIPDPEILDSSFNATTSLSQIRNLTPSIEAAMGTFTATAGKGPVPPMAPLDLPDGLQSHLLEEEAGNIVEMLDQHNERMVCLPAGEQVARVPAAGSQLACRFCGKVFKKAGRLLTHERKHTGERPFSCKECTKSFRDAAALEGHISRQHRAQPFHCGICNKGFSSKRQLMIHGRVHSGEKPFQCLVCNRKFSQEGNLHTHIRRHMVNFGLEPLPGVSSNSGWKTRRCRLCNFVVDSEQSLKTHVKGHIKTGDLVRLRAFMGSSDMAEAGDDSDTRRMSLASVTSDDSTLRESSDFRRESMDSVISME